MINRTLLRILDITNTRNNQQQKDGKNTCFLENVWYD